MNISKLLLLLIFTKGLLQINTESEDQLIENILNDESKEEDRENFTNIDEEYSDDYKKLKSFMKNQIINGSKRKTSIIQPIIDKKEKSKLTITKINSTDFSDSDHEDSIKKLNETALKKRHFPTSKKISNTNKINPLTEYVLITNLNKKEFYTAKNKEEYYIQKKSFYYTQLTNIQNDYKQKNLDERKDFENGLVYVYDKINFDIILTIETECLENENLNYKLCMKWSDFAFIWIHFFVYNGLKRDDYFISNYILYQTLLIAEFIEIYDWLLEVKILQRVFKEAKDTRKDFQKIFNDEN